MSFGDIHREAIYFVVITPDRAIIPCFDVAQLSTLDNITPSFYDEWQTFCAHLRYERDLSTTLQTTLSGYQIEQRDQMIIMLPPHFLGGFLKNWPDLYDCDSDRVLAFLQRSKMCLNDVRLRTSPQQRLIHARIHPYTFLNLSINDSAQLSAMAAQNPLTSPTVWCAIIAWWDYHAKEDDRSGKHADLVALIEAHCKARLLERCDFFLMVWSAAFRLGNAALNLFCQNHLASIILDEELISDVPQFNLHILKDHRFGEPLDKYIKQSTER